MDVLRSSTTTNMTALQKEECLYALTAYGALIEIMTLLGVSVGNPKLHTIQSAANVIQLAIEELQKPDFDEDAFQVLTNELERIKKRLDM